MNWKSTGMPLLIGCILIVVAGTSAAKNDGKKIVRNVEKTIEHLETLYCEFEQTIHREVDDRTIKRSGILYTKEPYKFRIEYPAQTIVGNGEVVWVYVPRNNQVQISDFSDDAESFPTPQSIFKRYTAEREIEFIGSHVWDGSEYDVLKLVSSTSEESKVEVLIDKKLNFPVKIIEKSADGDSTMFIARDVIVNGALDDRIFTFTIPEGVEVVDLRE